MLGLLATAVAAFVLCIGVASPSVAVQCGGRPSLPGEAFDLVAGKVASHDDAYAVGEVTARTKVADDPLTWALDVQMQLVFKGDVPQRITLFHTPYDPPVDFVPGHRYFFVLNRRAGQPADIPLGLDMCGPSFEISADQLHDLVGLAPPTDVYDETVAEGGPSGIDFLPIGVATLLVIGAVAVLKRAARAGAQGGEVTL